MHDDVVYAMTSVEESAAGCIMMLGDDADGWRSTDDGKELSRFERMTAVVLASVGPLPDPLCSDS